MNVWNGREGEEEVVEERSMTGKVCSFGLVVVKGRRDDTSLPGLFC